MLFEERPDLGEVEGEDGDKDDVEEKQNATVGQEGYGGQEIQDEVGEEIAGNQATDTRSLAKEM